MCKIKEIVKLTKTEIQTGWDYFHDRRRYILNKMWN